MFLSEPETPCRTGNNSNLVGSSCFRAVHQSSRTPTSRFWLVIWDAGRSMDVGSFIQSMVRCDLVLRMERGPITLNVARKSLKVSVNDEGAEIYRIRAVSKPRAALARIGYPITRMFQARFRRDSIHPMQRAVR